MSDRAAVLALPFVLPLAGLVLMLAAMMVPNQFVMEELHEAITDGTLETASYSTGYSGSTVDGFSECKRITVGIGEPAGGSVVQSAIRTPMLGSCELAVPAIEAWASGAGNPQGREYFRYWNGSAVVFRPLIAAVGVAGTRVLAGIGLAVVMALFWREASRRVGWPAATVAVIPIVATTDFVDLPGALLHALGMIVALGSAALLLRRLRPTSSLLGFAGATFTAGATFLYFGDMTNPDAAWAIAASSAAVVAVGADSRRAAAGRAAVGAVGWIVGFVWMWVAKWLIAVPVVGFDAVRSNVTNQVEFRLAGESDGGYTGSLTGSARRAFDAWMDQPLTLWILVVLVVVAIVVARRLPTYRRTAVERLMIGAPAIIPVAWHFVLRNHTHFHAWFTYRSFAVAAGVVLMAATARLVASSPAMSGATDGASGPVGVDGLGVDVVAGDRILED